MYTLFIDTHDKDIVLGLFKEGKTIDKSIKTSLRNHSDFTMPMIDELLKNNNLDVQDLNQILVVNGPGSFTGVRLGVTIAKTLAYTLNIPIKTITSLEAYAVSIESNKEKLIIIRDVKGVFGGLFTPSNKIVGELFYKANADFEEYVKSNNYQDIIYESPELNLDKIYEYMVSIEPTIAHKVNPIYIKVIEALKNDSQV